MTKHAELAHLFRALKAPLPLGRCPRSPTGPGRKAGAMSGSPRPCSQPRSALGTATAARAGIKTARFPARKTLEEFDFTFQRSVKKTVIEHLEQLDFLHARENVILLGPPDPWSHCPPHDRHWSNGPTVGRST
jgi:hypothetical protein